MDAPLRPPSPVTIIPFVIGADEIRRIQGEIQNALRCPVDLEGMETPVIQTPCGHPISAVAMAEQYKAAFPPGRVSVVAPKGTKCPTCRNEFTHYVKDDDLLAIVKVITSFLNNLLLKAENGDRNKLDVTEISKLCQSIINASLLSCGHLIAADELADNLNDKTRANCRQCNHSAELVGPNYATKAVAELVLELFAPLDKRCARAADKYDPKTSNAKSLDALFKVFSSLPEDSEAWKSLLNLFCKFLENSETDKISAFLTRVKKLNQGNHLPEFIKALKAKARKLKGEKKTRFERALGEYLPKKEAPPAEAVVKPPEVKTMSQAEYETLFAEHLDSQCVAKAQALIRDYKERKVFGTKPAANLFGERISKYILNCKTVNQMLLCMTLVAEEKLIISDDAINHYAAEVLKSVDTIKKEYISVLQGEDFNKLCYRMLGILIAKRIEDSDKFYAFFNFILDHDVFIKLNSSYKAFMMYMLICNLEADEILRLTPRLARYIECIFYAKNLRTYTVDQYEKIGLWLCSWRLAASNDPELKKVFFKVIDDILELLSEQKYHLQSVHTVIISSHDFKKDKEPVDQYFYKLVESQIIPNNCDMTLNIMLQYVASAFINDHKLHRSCVDQALNFLTLMKPKLTLQEQNTTCVNFMHYLLAIHDKAVVTQSDIEKALSFGSIFIPKINRNSPTFINAIDTLIFKSCEVLERLEPNKLSSFFEKILNFTHRICPDPDECCHLNLKWAAFIAQVKPGGPGLSEKFLAHAINS